MRREAGVWGSVAGLATFAAFLLASLALVITATDPTPGTGATVDAGGTAGFGAAWPWILATVIAIAGGLGLMIYAAREPAVGYGWPERMTREVELQEAETPTREGSVMSDESAGSAPPAVTGEERPRAGTLEIVTALAAVAALIVAVLAFVEAAAS